MKIYVNCVDWEDVLDILVAAIDMEQTVKICPCEEYYAVIVECREGITDSMVRYINDGAKFILKDRHGIWLMTDNLQEVTNFASNSDKELTLYEWRDDSYIKIGVTL